MRANTCDPAFKLLYEEITSDIQKHTQNLWKEPLKCTKTQAIEQSKTNNSQGPDKLNIGQLKYIGPSWTRIHHEHVENCS